MKSTKSSNSYGAGFKKSGSGKKALPSALVLKKSIVPPVKAAPLTEYRRFLNSLNNPITNNWRDVNVGRRGNNQDEMINEWAGIFNRNHPLGTPVLTAPANGINPLTGAHIVNEYGNDNRPGQNNPYLNLQVGNPPIPRTIGHELIHMNDHQHQNINRSIWRGLGALYNSNANEQAFRNSVGRIQDTIQPVGFRAQYLPNLDRNRLVGQVNQWEQQQNIPQNQQTRIPNQVGDWRPTFPVIDNVLSHNDQTTNVQNRPFLLNFGSEFPAFTGERLNDSWRNDRLVRRNLPSGQPDPNTLTNHERTFIDGMLGDMGQHYTQQNAPVTNANIQARRNSINLAKGGHVKNYAGGGYIMNNASYNPGPSSSLMQYMRPQQMDDPNMGDEEMDDSNIDMQNAYAKGGRVNQHPSSITEFIRQQGRDGDTILAHINPIEAHILKSIGGSGTINPKTGLPEFRGGFFSKRYWKKGAWKRDAAAIAGNVIGNMIMPGIGGTIGAALGSAAGTKIRGRNDYAGHMAKSAALAAIAPTVAGLAGTGANAMGATNVGHALTKYGNINAILPSIGFGGESSGVGSYMGPAMNAMGGSNQSPMQYMPQDQQHLNPQNPYVDNRSFGDKLSGNMKDYFTQPGNLLTLGTAAAQYMGRPKPVRPKTPEQLADEERRYRNASRMTAAEVEAEEELNAVRKNATKRHKDAIINQELANIGQLHRKVNSPEEYAQRGQWLEYYDNPQFTGERIRMKAGGQVHSPHAYLIEQETIYPGSLMGYIRGVNGGQDDDVNAMLSNGEYVIDASTVADLGDGNNEAGARKLDAFRERVRKHKRGGSINLPPKSKSLLNYMRG